VVLSTLLPSVIKSQPRRGRWSLGNTPNEAAIRDPLHAELADAFGSADDVFHSMSVKVIFKAVTYELLGHPEFMRIASQIIPSLDTLDDELDAGKAEQASK